MKKITTTRRCAFTSGLIRKSILPVSSLLLALAATNAKSAYLYWDPNGTTSVGGNGTWDTTSKLWSTSTSGLQIASSALVAYNTTSNAVFCAGPGSSVNQGSFTITVNSAINTP